MKKYKGYSIELVENLFEKLYVVYDCYGFYMYQAKTIKECKQYINDCLL